MDLERQQQAFRGALRKLDELPERVGLLAVEDAAVRDRAVAAPGGDGRERVVDDRSTRCPGFEHDRRKCRDPLAPTSWDRAPAADLETHGDEMAVGVESHVDGL